MGGPQKLLYPKYVYSTAGGWWNHHPVNGARNFAAVACVYGALILAFAYREETSLRFTQRLKSENRKSRFNELKQYPTDEKLIEILNEEAKRNA